MTKATEIWVVRDDLRKTKIVERELPALADGEVLVAIDKFGLTANNVSYAVSGDFIGYWKYYPATGDWGKVPVWGFANVVESNCADVPVGERLWGFFPMADYAVLQPGKVSERNIHDAAPHRAELPALYNQYARTMKDEDYLKALEVERCLLFPLFTTSYVLYDYLIDNDFFGAKQVLVGSASSKTGFGLAHLLFNDKNVSQRVVGLTSSGNVGFVKDLNVCDQIVTYGDEDQIDSTVPTAFVDMSGDGPLRTKLHNMLGDLMVESCMVGATHWDVDRSPGDVPGAKPTFFFAPSHIAKRNTDWGAGVIMQKAFAANAKIAEDIKGDMTVDTIQGAEAATAIWLDMLDNKVRPSRGIMVSLLVE